FLYGYSGMRWTSPVLTLNPSLNSGISGVTLNHIHWHGRTLTIAIGSRRTTVRLTHGAPTTVLTPNGVRRLARRHRLRLTTRRPDLIRALDTVRCGPTSATSAQPGAPAQAATDGSPATDWQPVSLPATLTARRRDKV